jgi:hydrogenase large subunit
MPHCASVVPGGVTVTPSVDKVTTFLWRLKELRDFISNVYLPDVVTVAEVYRDYADMGVGCKNLLSYGAFDLDNEPAVLKRKRFFAMGRLRDGKIQPVDPARITEDVASSWYRSASHLAPASGETLPDPKKAAGYSWVKAPRYENTVYEVGPMARAVMAYTAGGDTARVKILDDTLSHLRLKPENLFSVMGRHLCRAIETKVLSDAMADWVLQIKLEQPVAAKHVMPDQAQGYGLWDASRGALGHWISIRNKRIERYQAVVPTTWNASPRDDRGQPGAIEQALVGAPVKDPANPFSVARIVRSFDPCVACSIHLLTPQGKLLGKVRAV